jgi:hypothetical protein
MARLLWQDTNSQKVIDCKALQGSCTKDSWQYRMSKRSPKSLSNKAIARIHFQVDEVNLQDERMIPSNDLVHRHCQKSTFVLMQLPVRDG